MPMNAGSVNGAGVGTGLAKELFDDYSPKLGIVGVGAAEGLSQIADLCNSIAQVVVAHIAANATVSTSVTTSVAAGIPVATTGTAAAQAGATTAPGAGTGSGTGTVG